MQQSIPVSFLALCASCSLLFEASSNGKDGGNDLAIDGSSDDAPVIDASAIDASIIDPVDAGVVMSIDAMPMVDAMPFNCDAIMITGDESVCVVLPDPACLIWLPTGNQDCANYCGGASNSTFECVEAFLTNEECAPIGTTTPTTCSDAPFGGQGILCKCIPGP